MSSIDYNRLIKYGEELGADFVDIRYQDIVYEALVVDNGVVRAYNIDTKRGVGVRVLVKGFMGYSSTNKLDESTLKETVERAVRAAKSMEKAAAPTSIYQRKTVKDKIVSHYATDALDVDPGEKVELLMDMYKTTREVSGIASSTIRYGFERDHRIYVSSNGDYVETTIRLIGIGVYLVSSVEGVMERLWDSRSRVAGWEFIKNTDWIKFARENAELVVKAAKAPVVKPGRYTAVLDNEIVGLMLHEAFGHATEADIVEAGGSVLEGRIGEKIASELVTVVDNGRIEGGYYVPYDDEGTPKTKTITVEKGILKNYLHSLATASRLGGEPTGNARVMDYGQIILVRQTNTYMEPGDWDPEEMIRDTREGVYVRGKGAMGGQVDPSMGTFTFTAGPSYMIRNGELAELVRGVMLSGNILETLKNVDAVGKDLVVRTSVFGGCGKDGQRVRVGDGGPHVRVREITIGGGSR
ncbi:MAG: TldD/PmbA family protein [Thermoprotei archaeon]